ncbi:MAG TPA: hypothetical protein VKV77_08990 [Methylovirgula sp.]|nr:hypothetical protein [Methylovirgula sp.]
MRRALTIFAFLCCILCCLAPALGEVRIEASNGGEVGHFIRFFNLLRQSGERVVIDGPCYSACTLVLTMIPRDRLCVTRRAVLGFHAPILVDDYGREYSTAKATRAVNAVYPAEIRDWIRRHGGLSRRVIYLRGRALDALYPLCR